jgi:thiol-disulfide isomerase/thioredoxin
MTAPFQDADGAGVTVERLSGRSGAVVNLWATWCAPCIKEMPQLDALKGDLAEDGIAVLAISQDRGGLGQVKPFYDKQGFKNLTIHLDPNTAVARSAKVRGLPTTILYAPDGREMGRLEGVAEWDDPAAADFIRACLASGTGG